ncbi:unnamed protein product [Rhizoctonia solani]|uniref:NACHT domain-containing protein n=1 Tax=Rhizoctonia solani TaxID=456999 RepID=A0A8H3EBM2_9AGAM|nr:unnamed protein product [Rhizoctonia solani]
MPAAEWYKRQKDRFKRALHAQNQSLGSLPDSSNTPLPSSSAPQSIINRTDEGPEDTLGPLSSTITSSNSVSTPQSSGAIATLAKSQPNPVVDHKDSPTADETTAVAPSLPGEAPKAETQSKLNWSGLKALLSALRLGAGFGPLESAIGGLDRCVGIFEQTSKTRDDYRELGEKLDELLGDLAEFNNAWIGKAMTTSVKNLCSGIEAEIGIIEEKQARNAPAIDIEATEDLDTILECYRRIHGCVEKLMLNANLNMWKTLDEEMTDRRLLELSPSMSGTYNSRAIDQTRRRECTEGTRVPELEKLKGWARDPSGSAIYWINGMAGTGKTTIAYTLCAQLQTTNELAASFFCTQLMPECRDIQLIIPAIAYQLAQFSYSFRHELSKALGSDQVAHTWELKTQLETLIVRPLKAVQHTLPSRLVIVIDALDECKDADSIGKILELLAGATSGLPIRFLVSSRPEPEIYRRMTLRVGGSPDTLVLDEINPNEVQHDIEAYLRQELNGISLTSDQWNKLVKRCGVLFIYASTTCRYIKSNDEMMGYEEALDVVLGLSVDSEATIDVDKELDKLYTAILEVAFNKPHMNEVNRRQMKSILDTVVCAAEPMTTEMLVELLELKNAEHAGTLLRPLLSVVNVTEETGIVTTLHASFPDFMLNSNRSAGFSYEATLHHATLAQVCLQQIRENPVQFNICGIESSYLFDSQIYDIPGRIQRAISPTLLYACRHWISHLIQGNHSPDLLEAVFDFLSVRLLLWMEVLNLTKWSNVGLYELEMLAQWCREAHMAREVVELACDACDFVSTYCSQLGGKSTPHLYISMLAFWPGNSPIAKHYIPRTTGLPRPQGTAIARRGLPLLATWYVGNPTQVVCSYPTGSRIAMAVGNNICILDELAGETLLDPLEGHTDLVSCVSISSNGLYIASGSYDSTIRVWDANTGKLMTGPWKAHRNKVTSVAFSPDSARIASTDSSEDVKIWSVQNGEHVVSTRLNDEHPDHIRAAIFSSDGSMIISGNENNTMCFWDAHTGDLLSKQSREPSTTINSLALSTDGSRIICACGDGSICVWDTKTRQQVPGLTLKLGGAVTQAIFSPDNKYIAACHGTPTVCLWDAGSGELIATLDKHIDRIASISFSPDSSRLISCTSSGTVYIRSIKHPDVGYRYPRHIHSACFSSDGSQIITGAQDGSIWLWDTRSGKLAMGPLTGHKGRICSMAISSDGTYIASASSDKTIRLWDIKEAIGRYKVLEKYTKRQDTLSFTSDDRQLLYGSLAYPIGASPFTSEFETDTALYQRGRDEWASDVSGYDKCSITSSLDGSYVASGSADGTIQMWRAQTGQRVMGPIRGHTTAVSLILFSPDGKHLVSFSLDDVICFWPMPKEPRSRDTNHHASELNKRTSSATSSILHWKLEKSGWILNNRGEHLIWVPEDLRPYLLRPEADRLISHRGSLTVDFTGANIGELWTRCYRPG